MKCLAVVGGLHRFLLCVRCIVLFARQADTHEGAFWQRWESEKVF